MGDLWEFCTAKGAEQVGFFSSGKCEKKKVRYFFCLLVCSCGGFPEEVWGDVEPSLCSSSLWSVGKKA